MKVGDREMLSAIVNGDGSTIQRWATVIEVRRREGVVWLLADDGEVIGRPIARRARR